MATKKDNVSVAQSGREAAIAKSQAANTKSASNAAQQALRDRSAAFGGPAPAQSQKPLTNAQQELKNRSQAFSSNNSVYKYGEGQAKLAQAALNGNQQARNLFFSPTVSFERQLVDYSKSGKTNFADTQALFNKALTNSTSNYYSKENQAVWASYAEGLKGQLLYDQRSRMSDSNAYTEQLQKQLQQIENQRKTIQSQVNSGLYATAAGLNNDSLASYSNIMKERKSLLDQLANEEAKRNAWVEEAFGFFGGPDGVAAKQRLKENQYASPDAFRFAALGKNQLLSEDQKAKDQQLVDAINGLIGADQAYYNFNDKFKNVVSGAADSIGEGLLGAASISAKATSRKLEREGFFDREHLAGPVLSPEEKAGISQATVGEAQAAVSDIQDRIRQLELQNDNLTSSITGMDTEVVKQQQISANNKELKKLKAQQKAYEDRLKAADGETPSLEYRIDQTFNVDNLDALIDRLDGRSQAKILKAKNGSTAFGKAMIDMGVTGIQMGFDMAIGALTGGGALAPMFIRVLGQESAAARRDNASVDEQLAYGVAKATIEVVTEKVFGMFDKIGYGKGWFNGCSEWIVKNLAESGPGRTVIRALFDMGEEGAEEVLSDLLAPFADKLLSKNADKTLKELRKEELANWLYDFLLGAAMGGLGFAGGIATGQNRAANAKLYWSEVADTGKAINQRAELDRSRLSEAMKFKGDENVASEEEVLSQIEKEHNENPVQQSAAYQALTKYQQIMNGVISGKYGEEAIPMEDRLSNKEASILASMGIIDKDMRDAIALPRGTRHMTSEEKAEANAKGEKALSGYLNRMGESFITALGLDKAVHISPDEATGEEQALAEGLTETVKDVASPPVDNGGNINNGAPPETPAKGPNSNEESGPTESQGEQEKTVKPAKAAPRKKKAAKGKSPAENSAEYQKKQAEDKARQKKDNDTVQNAYTIGKTAEFEITYNGEKATAIIDAKSIDKANRGYIRVRLANGEEIQIGNPSRDGSGEFSAKEAKSWLYHHRSELSPADDSKQITVAQEENVPEEPEEVSTSEPEEVSSEEEPVSNEQGFGNEESLEGEVGSNEVIEDNIEDAELMEEGDQEESQKEGEDNEGQNKKQLQELAQKYAETGKEEDLKALKTYADDMGYDVETSEQGVTANGIEHKFSDTAKTAQPAPASTPEPAPTEPKAPTAERSAAGENVANITARTKKATQGATQTAEQLVNEAEQKVEQQKYPKKQAAAIIHAMIKHGKVTAEQLRQLFSSQSALKKLVVARANAPFAEVDGIRPIKLKDLTNILLDVLDDLGIDAGGYYVIGSKDPANIAKQPEVLKHFQEELDKYYGRKGKGRSDSRANNAQGAVRENTVGKANMGNEAAPKSESGAESGVGQNSSELSPESSGEDIVRGRLKQLGLTDVGINRLKGVLQLIGAKFESADTENKALPSLKTFRDICGVPFTTATIDSDTTDVDGATDKSTGQSEDSFGVVLFLSKLSRGSLGYTAAHESGHVKIKFHELKTKTPYTAQTVIDAAKKSLPIKTRNGTMDRSIGNAAKHWAPNYLSKALPSEALEAVQKANLEDVMGTIKAEFAKAGLSDETLNDFVTAINIELTNELLAGRSDMFEEAGVKVSEFDLMSTAARAQLVKDGVFTQEEMSELKQGVVKLNKESSLGQSAKSQTKSFDEASFNNEFGDVKDISEFDEDGPGAVYSVRVPEAARERSDLPEKVHIIVRNLSSKNVMRFFTTGGEAAPSAAIIKKGHNHEKFGECTIVYFPSYFDPQADPRNIIFSGDAWTPVHPDVHESNYTGSLGGLIEAVRNALKKYNLGADSWYLDSAIESFIGDKDIEGAIRATMHTPYTRRIIEAFLGDSGIKFNKYVLWREAMDNLGGPKAVAAWLQNLIAANGIVTYDTPQRVLFDEDTGDYIPYSLEAALDLMMKEDWQQKAVNANMKKLRPALLKKLNSFDEVRNESTRITRWGEEGTLSAEDHTPEKDAMYDNVREYGKVLIPKLANYYGVDTSEIHEWLAAIANEFNGAGFSEAELERIMKGPLYDSIGQEIDIPFEEAAFNEIAAYFGLMADLPTGYYEVKPQKVVGTDSAAAVLVPRDDYDLQRFLDDRGIKWFQYDDNHAPKTSYETGEILLDENGNEIPLKSRAEILAEDLGEYMFSKVVRKKAQPKNKLEGISNPFHVPLSSEAQDYWLARNIAPKGSIKRRESSETSVYLTPAELEAMGGHVEYASIPDLEMERVALANITMGLQKFGYKAVAEAYKSVDPERLTRLETKEIILFRNMLQEELWYRGARASGIQNTLLPASKHILTADVQAITNYSEHAKGDAGAVLRQATIETPEFKTLNNFKQAWAKDETPETLDPNSSAAQIIRFGQDTVNLIKDIEQRKSSGNLTDQEAKKELGKVLKEVNRVRNVQGIFDDSVLGPVLGKGSRWVENMMLDRVINKSDFDTIKMMSLSSLNRINSDFQNVSLVNTINQFRYMNMLSAPLTVINNVFNNLESVTTGAYANNLAYYWLGKKAEKIRGEQVLFKSNNTWFDRACFWSSTNKELNDYMKTKGAEAALSLLYGLDVDDGKIDIDLGAKHNQNSTVLGSNWIGSFMARYQLLTGLNMTVTDRMAIERDYKAKARNIDKLNVTDERKDALKQVAYASAAKQAYHSKDNFAGKAILKFREGLDGLKIGGKDSSLGLGTVLIPFVQVPVNVASRALEATPAGVVYDLAIGGIKLHQLQERADHFRAAEDARAARDAGQKLTDAQKEALDKWGNETLPTDMEIQSAARMIGNAGANMTSFAVAVIAAMVGALKNFDDEEDKEMKRLAQERGFTGLQINPWAIFRKNHEWKDNDCVIGGGWLEVLALPMAAGYSVAKAWEKDKSVTGALKAAVESPVTTFSKAIDVVASMPGVDQFYDMWTAYQNLIKYEPDQEERISKLGASGLQYAANTATSFVIPNSVATATAGFDNTVRDIYSEDSVKKILGNIVKSKIPGARGTIPESRDSLGEVRRYGDNKFMGLMNKAILPGTGVKVWQRSELEKEYARLKAAGVGGNLMPRKSAPNYYEQDGETYTYNANEKRTWDNTNTALSITGQQILMNTKGYKELSDEEKGEALRDVNTLMALESHQAILDSKNANVDVNLKGWQKAYFGEDDDGPDMNGLAKYLVAKYTFDSIWDSKENKFTDYAAADSFVTGPYKDVDEAGRQVLNGSYSWLEDFSNAKSEAKMTAKEFAGMKAIQDKYRGIQEDMKDLPDTDENKEKLSEISRDMAVEYEDFFGGRNAKSQWAQNNARLWTVIPASNDSLESWQTNTSLSTKEIDEWLDHKSKIVPIGGYETPSQNQRFMEVRDYKGIKDEKKRWEMIEKEASKGDDKDGDGVGDGGAWAKLKPYRDAGFTVEYALEHATYKQLKGRRYVTRKYNVIYPAA